MTKGVVDYVGDLLMIHYTVFYYIISIINRLHIVFDCTGVLSYVCVTNGC